MKDQLSESQLSELYDFGFLPPRRPPVSELPPQYKEWDERADKLSELIRDKKVVKEFENLPVLSVEGLEKEYFERASIILSYFAHAYCYEKQKTYFEKAEEIKIPESIAQPWIKLAEMRGIRPRLSIYEAVLFNWRLRNQEDKEKVRYSKEPESFTIDDVDPLVAVFHADDNNVERLFHLAIFEMEAKAIPLVRNIIHIKRVIENKGEKNPEIVIAKALQNMIVTLHEIRRVWQKISLNAHSKNFVDPIIWCNTMAVFTGKTPLEDLGMSGAGSPLFHLMDSFIGRDSYKSEFGHLIKNYFPLLTEEHQKFIISISVSNLLQPYLDKQSIKDLFNQVTNLYSGENGILHSHEIKAFGFLNLMKFTSRTQTNAEFKVDELGKSKLKDNFSESRGERTQGKGKIGYIKAKYSKTASSSSEKDNNNAIISEIEFQIPGNIPYIQPGSICKVLPPKNNVEAIERVLLSLKLMGEEEILLSEKSANKLCNRLNEGKKQGDNKFPLKTVLGYAELDQFPTKSFSEEAPLDVKLLQPRPYSIVDYSEQSDSNNNNNNSQLNASPTTGADTTSSLLKILVRKVDKGIVSNYLNDPQTPSALIKIKPGFHFHFMADNAPIVMIAGGTGIASFINYGLKKLKDHQEKKIIFLISARREKEYEIYKGWLKSLVSDCNIEIHVLLTEDQVIYIHKKNDNNTIRKFIGRIHDYMLSDDMRLRLGQLLYKAEKGEEDNSAGRFYICGGEGFASSVVLALKSIISREIKKSSDRSEIEKFYNEAVAQGRISLSISDESKSDSQMKLNDIRISELDLAVHNNEKNGFWVAVDDSVYDISNFLQQHPGGDRNLLESVGTDLTQKYQDFHKRKPEIRGVLSAYRIGSFEPKVDEKQRKILYECVKTENSIDIISKYKSLDLFILRLNEVKDRFKYIVNQWGELESKKDTQVFKTCLGEIVELDASVKGLQNKLQNSNDLEIVKKALTAYKRLLSLLKHNFINMQDKHHPHVPFDAMIELLSKKIKERSEQLELSLSQAEPVNIEPKMDHELVVIGAGLAGIVLAIFLKRNTVHQVQVYEKSEDPREPVDHTRASFNITLCKRGLDALDQIGLKEEVERFSVRVNGRRFHFKDDQPKSQLYGLPGDDNAALYVIKREDLLLILLKKAEKMGITIKFDTICNKIFVQNNYMKIELSNQLIKKTCYTVSAKRVFGADGAFSKVREFISGEQIVEPDPHKMIYREFSLPRIEGGPMQDKDKLHIWPRGEALMLMGFPNKDASFTLTLFIDENKAKSKNIKVDALALIKFFDEEFPDISPYVQNLIKNEVTPRWNQLNQIMLKKWVYDDKALLIGDAAHAFYPFYGQAANCAFEDCKQLAELIEKYKDDWKAIFETFFQNRKKDVDTISKLAADHKNFLSSPDSESSLRNEIEVEVATQSKTSGKNLCSLYYNISFNALPYYESEIREGEYKRIIDKMIEKASLESDKPLSQIVKEVLSLESGNPDKEKGIKREEVSKILPMSSNNNSYWQEQRAQASRSQQDDTAHTKDQEHQEQQSVFSHQ